MVRVSLSVNWGEVRHTHKPHYLSGNPKYWFNIFPRSIIALDILESIDINPLAQLEGNEEHPIQNAHGCDLIFEYAQIADTSIEPNLHGGQHIDIGHFGPLVKGAGNSPLS